MSEDYFYFKSANESKLTTFSEGKAKEYAKKGLIDPLQNLKGSPVFLLEELDDQVVDHSAALSVAHFYNDMHANVQKEAVLNLYHTFPI